MNSFIGLDKMQTQTIYFIDHLPQRRFKQGWINGPFDDCVLTNGGIGAAVWVVLLSKPDFRLSSG
ncbi:hypothetical protein IHE27_02905 (plasmid) [Mycetohabitans endofungorum]